MTPLGMIVAGLGLVVADFRFNGFDLVPDVIGWGVVLVGLTKLAARSPWFTAASAAATVGVVLGLPLLLAKPGPVLSAVEGLVLAIVVFGTCTGIREVMTDPRTRANANLIRWTNTVVILAGLTTSLLVGPTEVTGSAGFGVVMAVLVAFAFLVWFLVFLWSNRKVPALGALRSRTQPEPVG